MRSNAKLVALKLSERPGMRIWLETAGFDGSPYGTAPNANRNRGAL